ncbi:hypothetical protein N7475_006461 [Penicillium sp. IBT 31633x]|nr:hypothetical protein N7475_006461 [Penicillium sp. IBT 31633x]
MTTYPSKHDGPSQIRSYLMNVLITKHGLSPAHVHSVAECWKFGREKGLRQASKSQFCNLFGDIGPHLHDSVSEDLVAAWRSTLPGSLNLALIYGIPALAIFLLCRLYWHTRSASLKSGSLHVEILLWVSGPILLYCNAREISHRSELGREDLVPVWAIFSVLGVFAMAMRLLATLANGS